MDRRTDGQKQSLNPASAYAHGVIIKSSTPAMETMTDYYTCSSSYNDIAQ